MSPAKGYDQFNLNDLRVRPSASLQILAPVNFDSDSHEPDTMSDSWLNSTPGVTLFTLIMFPLPRHWEEIVLARAVVLITVSNKALLVTII